MDYWGGFTGRLGSFAFHSCANLETVILPTSDIVFPSYAFTDCVKLVTMKRADNLDAKNEIDLTAVTSIGNYALQNTAVTTVKVQKKYAISHYCFMNCLNLNRVQFDAMQDAKVTIGKVAFYGVDLSCVAYMNEVLVNDIDFVIPISETSNMIKRCY